MENSVITLDRNAYEKKNTTKNVHTNETNCNAKICNQNDNCSFDRVLKQQSEKNEAHAGDWSNIVV